MFSDHNKTHLKISNKKIARKSINICKLNNTLPNNPWIKEEIIRKTRNIFN